MSASLFAPSTLGADFPAPATADQTPEAEAPVLGTADDILNRPHDSTFQPNIPGADTPEQSRNFAHPDQNTAPVIGTADDVLNRDPTIDKQLKAKQEDSGWGNVAKGAASGVYRGIAATGNFIPGMVNLGLDTLHGLGAAETPAQMSNTQQPSDAAPTQDAPTNGLMVENGPNRLNTINPNPFGYKPNSTTARIVEDAAEGITGVGLMGGMTGALPLKVAGKALEEGGLSFGSRLARSAGSKLDTFADDSANMAINPATKQGAINLGVGGASAVGGDYAADAAPDDYKGLAAQVGSLGAGGIAGLGAGLGDAAVTSSRLKRAPVDVSYTDSSGNAVPRTITQKQLEQGNAEVSALLPGGKADLPALADTIQQPNNQNYEAARDPNSTDFDPAHPAPYDPLSPNAPVPGYKQTLDQSAPMINGQRTSLGELKIPAGQFDPVGVGRRLVDNNAASKTAVDQSISPDTPTEGVSRFANQRAANAIAETQPAIDDAKYNAGQAITPPLSNPPLAGDTSKAVGNTVSGAINDAFTAKVAPLKTQLDQLDAETAPYSAGTQRIKAIAQKLQDATVGEDGTGTGTTIHPSLAPIIDHIMKWPDTVPIKQLNDTMSNLSTAGRVISAQSNGGGNAKPDANVNALRGSIIDSINNSAADVSKANTVTPLPEYSVPRYQKMLADHQMASMQAEAQGQPAPQMSPELATLHAQANPVESTTVGLPPELAARTSKVYGQYGAAMQDAETGILPSILTRNAGGALSDNPETLMAGVLKGSKDPSRAANVQQLLDYSGNDPKVKAAIEDGVIGHMKDTHVLGDDGTVDPAKLQRYMGEQQNSYMFDNSLPELRDKLTNASTAQTTVNDAINRQEAVRQQYGSDKLAPYMTQAGLSGGKTPQELVNAAVKQQGMPGIKAVGQLVRYDPVAQDSLKRMIANALNDMHGTPDSVHTDPATGQETPVPGQFNATKFRQTILQNKDALKAAGGGSWLANLDRVASMENKSQLAAVPPVLRGTSTTTPQALAARKYNVSQPKVDASNFDYFKAHMASDFAHALKNGGALHAIMGTPATVAAYAPFMALSSIKRMGNVLHQKGIQDQNSLRTEMFLHPDLTAQMAKTVPADRSWSPRIQNQMIQALQSAGTAQIPNSLQEQTDTNSRLNRVPNLSSTMTAVQP